MIFRIILVALMSSTGLCGTDKSCMHNHVDKCKIYAIFGNIDAITSIEVIITCRDLDELSGNQFSSVDKISWDGCNTFRNIKDLGLGKVMRKNLVKHLTIENFAMDSLQDRTFDGFSGLEFLSFQSNSIDSLASSCFDELINLRSLEMKGNDFKWIDAYVFGDLPKLNTLDVDEKHLNMSSYQFRENQVEVVKLKIYHIEMDLLEHLMHHVKNLSISISSNNVGNDCHQVWLNGYEKSWTIQNLTMENFSCGAIVKNVDSMKILRLFGAVQEKIFELKLENLPNIDEIILHGNFLQNFKLDNLNNLTVFDLSNNNFEEELDMQIFEALPSIKTIKLESNFLKELKNINWEKFQSLLVDGNNFDCSWLVKFVTSSETFNKFVYTSDFKSLNIKGLQCKLYNESEDALSHENHESLPCALHGSDEKLIAPRLAIVGIMAILLGITIAFLSIYIQRKRQFMNQTPFYHILRDSVFRPICDSRSTTRSDLKEILSRSLPPTNYEDPLPYKVTDLTDIPLKETTNIYEEIPQRNSFQESV